MNPKTKKIIKLYWPTLIFGISAIASGAMYPMSLTANMNLISQILGWIGVLATMAVFPIADLTYKFWGSIGLKFMGTGTKSPTPLGWIIYLLISLLLIFFLNLLAVKIIKLIKMDFSIYAYLRLTVIGELNVRIPKDLLKFVKMNIHSFHIVF